MSFIPQGVGRGKILVQLGASIQSGLQAPEGSAFGSVVKAWWSCEVVQAGDSICFIISGNATKIQQSTTTYYIIDEQDYLFTETPAP